MMTENQFQDYCRRLNLTEAAIQYVQRVRTSGPSRKVRCGINNVTAQYPSRKMNRMVPAESHRVELAFIELMEHDDSVLEFYAQPLPIKLTYSSASGRSVGVIHTPDFFLVQKDAVGWVECKTEENLKELSVKQPNRYRHDDHDGWQCPPGEEAARQLGLFYRLWSSAQINPVLLRNMRFLEDYLIPDCPDVPDSQKQSILETVRRIPGVTAQELVEDGSKITYEHVFTLIGQRQVYVDLNQIPLIQIDRLQLYSDEYTALALRCAQISQSSRRFPTRLTDTDPGSRAAQATIPTEGSSNQVSMEVKEILDNVRAEEMDIANRRFEILQKNLDSSAAGVSPRTLSRWWFIYREAEQRYGCGYVGLIPRVRDRGNRTPRFPQEVVEVTDRVIAERCHSSKGWSAMTAFGALQIECEQKGMLVPSYQWFTKHIRQKETATTSEIRDSIFEPQKTEATISSPGNSVHGDRPWEVVHIDHTLCDIELVDEECGMHLGRPWLTIALDACSRRVLGFFLSFDRPTYRSCLMVMRECARRHGRLPDCVIVDGGSEFKHVYFETFCARYGIVLKTRPAARPYFGSVIERLFGTIGTQFFQNLAGNTRVLNTSLKITAAIHPKKDAVWTLESVHDFLTKYLYDLYDAHFHPALQMTPGEAFEHGMEHGGFRASRQVAYDEDLIAMTLPTTRNGAAKVQAGIGVKINYGYYWSDEMRKPQVIGKSVPVRYDPWNLAVAYAYLGDKWVRCISAHAQAFHGRSERELMLASAKLLRAASKRGEQYSAEARKIAQFFMSVEGEEKLRKQRMKDLALKRAKEKNQQSLEYDLDFSI